MEKRSFFSELLKYDRTMQSIKCANKKVTDYPEILHEMYYRQALLTTNFTNQEAEKGIKWLIGFANFINQNYELKKNHYRIRTYTRGDMLWIDFFGNFNNELTYDHPAIVLYDLGYGLIVAPTTSNKQIYTDAALNSYHVRLQANVPPYGYMEKNSTIKLDNLRFISKSRILGQMKRDKYDPKTKKNKKINQQVRDKVKLKEIEEALLSFLTPTSFNEFNETKNQLSQLQLQNNEFQSQLEELKKQNEKLQSQLDELQYQNNSSKLFE